MAKNANAPMDGGCTCGAVRYRLTDRPLFVHCCHCTWCQRETGSAFVINALIETDKVEMLQGEVRLDRLPSASGNGQTLARCPSCGVTLWSHYKTAKEKVHFMRAGTLDDPSWAPPTIHIFTSTKAPWVILPGDVPAVPEYYDRSQYWPAASIARYRAATGLEI